MHLSKLFTSYFWNALVNFFDAEEDDEDSDDKEENNSVDIDGKEISCEDYFKLFNNCFNKFCIVLSLTPYKVEKYSLVAQQ